ncbi:hypothetical protein R5R35_013688 [Gryllus longicercus]|uniref:C2H2-type domain-containing protein n=1 Tax=Gryllus longicercus TaxID=2509291 RepID=A0AAN9V9S0_9ORTH
MTGSVCSVAVDTSDLLVQCFCGCSHCCLGTEIQQSVPVRQELKEARPLKHKHKSQHQLVSCSQESQQKTNPGFEDFEKSFGSRKDSAPRSFTLKRKYFKCDLCKSEFTRKQSLTVHLQKHMCQQGQENVDTSNSCRSVAVPYNNLKAAHSEALCHQGHLNDVGTIKQSSCNGCAMVLSKPSSLATHRSVHSGECNHMCNICGKCFATHASLQSHAVSHRSLKAFVCALCGAAFSKKDSLTIHLRKHTGERPFTCDICGAAFNRQFTLKNHRALHSSERPHVCAACGKAFLTRAALASHERTSHTGTQPLSYTPRKRPQDCQPVVCDQCGKVYSNAANLRIHKRTHTGLRPFLCSVCGTAFGKKYTLQCHMRHHTNERPFSCEDCGAAFFRRSTLATHRHRHTGVRPHRCKLCGQGFIQSASLVYHLEHHEHATDLQQSTAAQKTSRSQVTLGRTPSSSS